MSADQEHEMTGRDWAEEYLPVRADQHHANVEPPFVPVIDLAKIKRAENWIITLFCAALAAAGLTAVLLSVVGVN